MIPDKNRSVPVFGSHALRHVVVSLWGAQGLSPKRKQELARHSSLAMMIGLYGHLWTDQKGILHLVRKGEGLIL